MEGCRSRAVVCRPTHVGARPRWCDRRARWRAARGPHRILKTALPSKSSTKPLFPLFSILPVHQCHVRRAHQPLRHVDATLAAAHDDDAGEVHLERRRGGVASGKRGKLRCERREQHWASPHSVDPCGATPLSRTDIRAPHHDGPPAHLPDAVSPRPSSGRQGRAWPRRPCGRPPGAARARGPGACERGRWGRGRPPAHRGVPTGPTP